MANAALELIAAFCFLRSNDRQSHGAFDGKADNFLVQKPFRLLH